MDYNSIVKSVADHRHLYNNAGKEVVTYKDNGSDTHPGHWKGWTTCDLVVPFDDSTF